MTVVWEVVRHEGDVQRRYVREVRCADLSDRRLVVIGKNPSTADRDKPDPTFRAVQAWAGRSGFGRICLVNLFSLRSANPRDIELDAHGPVALEHAVGQGNDDVLREEAVRGTVVAAWGDDRKLRDRQRYRARVNTVLDLLSDVELHVVGPLAANGFPSHGFRWNGLMPDVALRAVAQGALRQT